MSCNVKNTARRASVVDSGAADDTAAFVRAMMELRATNGRAYRALLGVMRAMYLTHNPKPRRGDSPHERAMHAHIVSKVRPIDYRRVVQLRTSRKTAVASRVKAVTS